MSRLPPGLTYFLISRPGLLLRREVDNIFSNLATYTALYGRSPFTGGVYPRAIIVRTTPPTTTTTTQHSSKSTEITDFSDMTCSENPGPAFSEVCEALQAYCTGEQSLEQRVTTRTKRNNLDKEEQLGHGGRTQTQRNNSDKEETRR